MPIARNNVQTVAELEIIVLNNKNQDRIAQIDTFCRNPKSNVKNGNKLSGKVEN